MKLPIIVQILKDIHSNNLEEQPGSDSEPNKLPIHKFKGYKFVHGIVLAPPKMEQEGLGVRAEWFKRAEDLLFTQMVATLKDDKMSYNLIGCREFLLMVPRRAEKIGGEIGVNAICFMGSILVKNSKFFSQIEQSQPSKLLSEITYPLAEL
jgi:ATP adenylyltransferase/5',5'''-P-1,P-4-tetraphosphate phosphorylase II